MKYDTNNNEEEDGELFDFDSGDEIPEADRQAPGAPTESNAGAASEASAAPEATAATGANATAEANATTGANATAEANATTEANARADTGSGKSSGHHGAQAAP